jgi:hypothetical protein
LIAGGLFSKIAIAFQPGQHRNVSYCLLAKELGATRSVLREVAASRFSDNKNNIVEEIRRTLSKTSRNTDGRRRSMSSGGKAQDKDKSIAKEAPHDDESPDDDEALDDEARADKGITPGHQCSRIDEASTSQCQASTSEAGPSGSDSTEAGPSGEGAQGKERSEVDQRMAEVLRKGDFPDDPEKGEDQLETPRRASLGLPQLVASGDEQSGSDRTRRRKSKSSSKEPTQEQMEPTPEAAWLAKQDPAGILYKAEAPEASSSTRKESMTESEAGASHEMTAAMRAEAAAARAEAAASAAVIAAGPSATTVCRV